MITKKVGKVVEIDKKNADVQWIKVTIGDEEFSAINYPPTTGMVKPGDEVVLNTTAVEHGLGTGGYHLVMLNLANMESTAKEEGHIMKLRYTPYQIKVLAVEEQANPHHGKISNFKNLDGIPVMIGSLHSKLAPAALGYKLVKPRGRLVYIMTDGGALPIAFSKTVTTLKELELIDGTITVGHAFGGDYEAVNVYSGLIAAKEVLNADAVIICMGPGVVGTGTKWGFTGIEQGDIINAVNILEGRAIAIPRITFKDKRDRHKGLSHHTLTILEKVALQPAEVCLPALPRHESEFLKEQIRERRLDDKHIFVTINAEQVIDYANHLKIPFSTMGRTVEEEPYYFLAAGAAGVLAAQV
ncbi:MAG: DUF3866 family protein [Clostridia bacterium]|nr:DUF3866 family protein [Clostridia bacterium]